MGSGSSDLKRNEKIETSWCFVFIEEVQYFDQEATEEEWREAHVWFSKFVPLETLGSAWPV